MAERTYKKAKTEAIESIKGKKGKSNIMILTDHQGLTVAQITVLRNRLFDVNAQYNVVKNTLAYRAISEEGQEKVKEALNGPSSIIFGYGDVVAPARIVVTFSRENEKPAVKGAIMDGRFMDTDEIKKLAMLPSKEILLAKVVGGIKSPLVSLANVLQGPIRKLVYALNEISKKKGV
ncbi:MAG: 50S ribosomal protein L10 [Candidatus Margulisiibacteriota bacterium]